MPIYRFMDQNLGQGQSPDFKTWTQEFDFYFQELYDDQEFSITFEQSQKITSLK